MNASEKVTITRRETIKPSSPTPTHKNTLKLSCLDQLASPSYVSLILVYPSNNNLEKTSVEKCQQLKTSLSKTLALFYPLAGRIINNSYVDCDDSGVEFIEAKIQSPLPDFSATPDVETLQQLVATPDYAFGEVVKSSLLLVQATFFECGGMVIGVSMSHKIADAATISLFIRCWSAISLGNHPEEELIPIFMGDSYVPPIDTTISMAKFQTQQKSHLELKRFIFDSIKLAAFRDKVVITSDPNLLGIKPTRFELVSALIWKYATTSPRVKINHLRPSIMCFPVNLRKRVLPALLQAHVGNFVAISSIKMHNDCCKVNLNCLISEIRKEVNRLNYELDEKKMLKRHNTLEIYNQFNSIAVNDDVDRYFFSSWCNFKLYENDFGWGNPMWLSVVSAKIKNVVILMDTRDGKGVEAWVCLEKDEMILFESNLELLELIN